MSAVTACCRARRARLGPVTRSLPRWTTSKTPTVLRTALCSATTPAYCRGMSQPPNSSDPGPQAFVGVEKSGLALGATFAQPASGAEREPFCREVQVAVELWPATIPGTAPRART